MPRLLQTTFEPGKRTTVVYRPMSVIAFFADIAAEHGLPLIAHGPKPATEETVTGLIRSGFVAVTFLAMAAEAAANEFGETAFANNFENFELCREEFGKGPAKALPQVVKKWYWLFHSRGRGEEFLAGAAPGLTCFIEEARHVLTHYKLSKHAEKWVVEEELDASPKPFRTIFDARDTFRRQDDGVIGVVTPAAVRRYYDAVRTVFVNWYEAIGHDPKGVDDFLPPPSPPTASSG